MAQTDDIAGRDFLYRDVIECIASGVAAFRAVRDPASGEIVDFTWILQNACAEKISGRTEAELIGKRLLQELPELEAAGAFERYVQVVETGEPCEITIEHREGRIRGFFSLRAVKLGDGFAVAFNDVTAEVQGRLANELLAKRFALATSSAGIGVWEQNLDTGERTWDDITYALFDCDPSEPDKVTHWRRALHPDDLAHVETIVQAAIAAEPDSPEATFGLHFRLLRPDGSIRLVESHGRLVASEGSRRIVGVNWDATEEDERRRAVETLANRLSLAASAAGIGVWERDADTDEAIWDETSRRMFGFTRDEPATTARWRKAVHPDDLGEAERVVDAARASGGKGPDASFRIRFRVVHPSGAIRHIESSGRLAVSGSGRRLVGVNRDMTAEVEAARELDIKRREAEAANIAKSQFVAVMSHEIRTPLNGVLGMAALLGTTELSERQRKMLKTIEQSGDELLEILNGILDLSRIESGRIEIEEAPFDLDELLRRAGALFCPQATEKGVAFRIEANASARGQFVGDGTRVRQVLYNLLSNAVKFTHAGEIVVTADVMRRSVKEGSSLELVLAVRDTGIGVPADKLDRIFQPFTQADGSLSRKFGGTGLGLSIAAKLSEMLGGSISVQSEEGGGSTFTARLRVAAAPAAATPVEDDFSEADELTIRPRILVAEDNPTNQIVLKGLLTACGAEAAVVENGLKAIDAWAAEAFDLILLDIQMPVMDGVAAAREIRALESQTGRARTPIVAVSANALTHQVESYLAAGMDGHLAKPIRPADMVEAIRRHIGVREEDDFLPQRTGAA